jgi:hypothetical protein
VNGKNMMRAMASILQFDMTGHEMETWTKNEVGTVLLLLRVLFNLSVYRKVFMESVMCNIHSSMEIKKIVRRYPRLFLISGIVRKETSSCLTTLVLILATSRDKCHVTTMYNTKFIIQNQSTQTP